MVAVLLLVLSPWTARAQESRWEVGETVAEGKLPRLMKPLVLDGDLGEWETAASLSLRYSSYIAQLKPGHEWLGPKDAGAEVYCAWNDDGLCLAAAVADDFVHNEREPGWTWQQDSLELFLDGRVGDEFMKPPYTKGAYQMFVRPPVGDTPAGLYVNERDGTIDGLKIAGKPTKTGYVVEMLIPWSAFPVLKPTAGSRFGLQASMCDYDERDKDTDQPMVMSWRAATSLYAGPQKFIDCELVEALPLGADMPLGSIASLDLPSSIAEGDSAKVAVEIGTPVARSADTVEIEIRDWNGKTVLQETMDLRAMPEPWSRSDRGVHEWPLGDVKDGAYRIEIRPKDGRDNVLGSASRGLMVTRRSIPDAKKAMERAYGLLDDVPRLAEEQPFKALACMGVAACVENLKRALELDEFMTVNGITRELNSRLDVLEKGTPAKDAGGMFDLLALGAEPDAQVVIEYPVNRPNMTTVSFYWGAFPLAGARVYRLGSAEEAANDLSPVRGRVLVLDEERDTFMDMPVAVSDTQERRLLLPWGEFKADRQVLLWQPQSRNVFAVDMDLLRLVQAEAVVLLDHVTSRLRRKVKAWARQKDVPLVPLSEAAGHSTVLLAGNCRKLGDDEPILQLQPYEARVEAGPVRIGAAWGRRQVQVAAVTREAAELILNWVVRGTPITVQEVDGLRRMIVEGLGIEAGKPVLPDGFSLYCGDLHSHTFHSDGTPSPLSLVCQSMYCNMDYLAMTDHNTIEGALVVRTLMDRHDCGYAMIIGEEITMGWSHMNAYPLREPVPWDRSPYETIKAAHRTGAVIQWNHPGYPRGDWAAKHCVNGIAGTALDAWEHYPPRYREWKKQKMLPVLVGTTDTHNGTFGDLERTVVLAPSPAGDDVAEAIRRGRAVLLNASLPELFYGSDAMIELAAGALAEGEGLKAAARKRIAAALAGMDLATMVRKSPPKVVDPDEFAATER